MVTGENLKMVKSQKKFRVYVTFAIDSASERGFPGIFLR